MNTNATSKPHFLKAWRVLKLRARFALLTFFFILIAAGLTVYSVPPQYYSKVRMEVKPLRSYTKELQPPMASNDPQFMAAQFQIIQSTETLYPVIDRLELVREFSSPGRTLTREQVYDRLKQALQLQQLRDTGLIELGVYDTDQTRAANIANTIAAVYQERRRMDRQRNWERGMELLRHEVDKLREAVEAAKGEATALRQQSAIMDPNPDDPTATPSYGVDLGE
jgi:uncharacterized protein involved in exopolysaccharide biosynthesis